ncbi:MAG: 1,4-alpha-glucan branching protein GlgB [Renibacterium sp.]|nr:1,4-alpha-glucan branching protein GlgB [Renibacterium sp.]
MPSRTPTIPELLQAWLPGRRWFPAKNQPAQAGGSDGVRLRRVGGFTLAAPVGLTGEVPGLEVHLVAVDSDGRTDVLQIPLSYRSAPLPDAEGFLLGSAEHPELGTRWIYDAVHDPVFIAAWLEFMQAEHGAETEGISSYASAEFRAGYEPGKIARIRPISSEQSNSSVIVRGHGFPVIVKFFRVLNHGVNPDIEVGRALTAAGSAETPALHGWLQAVWSDSWAAEGAPVRPADFGSLSVLHQLVPEAEDGWDLAVASASSAGGQAETAGQPGSVDFSVDAELLGSLTARLHSAMRGALGETALDPAARLEFLGALAGRVRWAWDQAGAAVGPYQEQIEQILADLMEVREVASLQRIHGDLHLGQLIRTGTRETGLRWFVLDFEGEPLRPVAERSSPDIPLRDVVGMLRSIDYAAATAGQQHGEWAERTSTAFLRAYCADRGRIEQNSPLFLALWLDKALYEVVYELRNRPSWLHVPVNAVQRLLRSLDSEESESPMAPDEIRQPGPSPIPASPNELAKLSAGLHHDPHSVLGAHPDDHGRVTVRALRHLAEAVSVRTAGGTVPMRHEFGGVWVAVLDAEEPGQVPDYRIEARYSDGANVLGDDPYRFLPTLGEVDLHLIGEGRHEELWKVLGAHPRSYPSVLGEVHGVSFAVWAPNAQAVRVKADFNGWDGRGHAMRSLGSSGVWEIFIPEAQAGSRYKFEILGKAGIWQDKADPMAFGTEVPPLTASKVTASSYEFQDADWMAQRGGIDPHNSPMSVYEVHLGSWRPGLSYLDLSRELVEYVQWLGFTHVEFMPVAEHPFGGSWGYQVTSYFAPTSRFGHPDEFRHLVDALHGAGIGVIVDWVPAHFPKDEWALARFDGGPLYEHSDPRLGEHPDWGTLIFDFGRSEVRNFLTANALYWFEEFHVDGLRVDAVASMLYLDYSREAGEWAPNRWGGRENLEAISFLQEVNATAYKRSGGVVMIAEESTAFPGVTAPTDQSGLGFGLKWNMGWMHDSLTYIAEDPINRKWHHDTATFSLAYAFTENFLLPISHDEVVHGKGSMLRKMPGDRWQQLANLRAFLAWQWAHPGKQLIFMGTEFGQEAEWSEQHGLDWWLADMPPHRGMQLLVRQLNETYRATPALWEQDNSGSGFEWINASDADRNVLSFIRWDRAGKPLVCVVNFSGAPHHDYRLGLPSAGRWREALNTDAQEYGGSGVGNGGSVQAGPEPWDGKPASAVLTLPPLGTLYLVPES